MIRTWSYLPEYAKIANVNKKVIGKMKDELGKGFMTEFVAVSPKVYAYKESRLDNTLIEHKKAKGTKKWLQKRAYALICTNSVYTKIKILIAYNIG